MSRKKNTWTYHFVALGLGIGIVVALVYCTGFGRFWQIIARTSLYWMTVSVAFYAASWFLRTWRLRQLTNHAGKTIGRLELFKLYISGFALNSILPARFGDVATAVLLKTKGIDMGRSAAIVVQSRVLDAFALVVLSLPAFVSLLEERIPLQVMAAILLGTAIVLVPIGIVVLDAHNMGSAILERVGRKGGQRFFKLAFATARDAYESYREIISDRRLLLVSMALSLMMALCEGLTCFTISVALGARIPIIAVFAAVSIATLGKAVPGTPGGIGIYEGLLAGVLVLFGVGFDVALVVAILDHGMKKVFNLLLGLPATAGMGFRMAQIHETAGNERPWTHDARRASAPWESYHEGQ